MESPLTLNARFWPSYRGTSLIRNHTIPGPSSRPMHRALWCSLGGRQFLMSEVPVYRGRCRQNKRASERQGYPIHGPYRGTAPIRNRTPP